MLEPDPRILEAAEKLLRAQGYEAVLLADVAREAAVALPAVMLHYPDKITLLQALLHLHDPRESIRQAFKQFHGGTPEEKLRYVIQELLGVFDAHQPFAFFAVLDVQVNEGRYLSTLLQDLTSDAASFINRLSTMPGVRPVSTVMLGRALAAYLLGFMATQLLAPTPMQATLRLFPTKTWVDGMTQIILYGILESPPSP